MRHGSSNRRSRNRNNNGRRNGNQKTQVFDSNGPEVRIRGTAHQICEKYVALAKDAAAMGDKVLAESYLQHSEHYQRMINSWQQDDQPNMSQKQDQSSETYSVKENQKPSSESDLSLPASILGDEVKVEDKKVSEAVRSSEELESV